LPDLRVPFFLRCIALFTERCAFFPYRAIVHLSCEPLAIG
jgi:hypothetical protein